MKNWLSCVFVFSALALQPTVASAAGNNFELTGVSGEWFSPISLSLDDNELSGRYLVIKGTLRNLNSAEVMEDVQCVAKLRVTFENGRSVDIESEDICSDKGAAAAAAKLMGGPALAAPLVMAPNAQHSVDTSFGGAIMSALRGPTFPGKYKPYPMKDTRLSIVLTAKTVFGDHVKETLVSAQIPAHTHASKFSIQ